MPVAAKDRTVIRLLEKAEWSDAQNARQLVEGLLLQEPNNHWLLTQLGSTLYEQRKYRESLRPLRKSLKIAPECPLTLWHLAGALDALGKPKLAISIYNWLIRCRKTAQNDPCWETADWADSLKADCLYRMGLCFAKLKRWTAAENCLRQFIELAIAGVHSIYTIDAAAENIRQLPTKKSRPTVKRTWDSVNAALTGLKLPTSPNGPPNLSEMR